mmetsp:Transcript_25391/g.31775  ORF Transcript_25391/g.31775 Transcript_25391/m.31775 type:complete len:211 (+) Transcript_25391:361-993(+)
MATCSRRSSTSRSSSRSTRSTRTCTRAASHTWLTTARSPPASARASGHPASTTSLLSRPTLPSTLGPSLTRPFSTSSSTTRSMSASLSAARCAPLSTSPSHRRTKRRPLTRRSRASPRFLVGLLGAARPLYNRLGTPSRPIPSLTAASHHERPRPVQSTSSSPQPPSAKFSPLAPTPHPSPAEWPPHTRARSDEHSEHPVKIWPLPHATT